MRELTKEQVKELLWLYHNTDMRVKMGIRIEDICKTYGISTNHLYRLVRQGGWKDPNGYHQTAEHRKKISDALKEYHKAVKGIRNLRKVAPGVWKQVEEDIKKYGGQDRVPKQVPPSGDKLGN